MNNSVHDQGSRESGNGVDISMFICDIHSNLVLNIVITMSIKSIALVLSHGMHKFVCVWQRGPFVGGIPNLLPVQFHVRILDFSSFDTNDLHLIYNTYIYIYNNITLCCVVFTVYFTKLNQTFSTKHHAYSG